MAFLDQVSHRGKKQWRIVWHDATRGAGRVGRREVRCKGGDHSEAFDAAKLEPEQRAALSTGATNPTAREALRKCYDALEIQKHRDAARTAAAGVVPSFETPAVDFVGAYRDLLAFRVAMAEGTESDAPTDFGWRMAMLARPMKPRAAAEDKRTLDRFAAHLPPGITTGNLTGEHVAKFLIHARTESKLAPSTVNKMRAHLTAMFGAVTAKARKKYFRTNPADWFRDEAEALPESQKEIVTHTAAEVVAFMEAAERYADPNRTMRVERRKQRSRAPLGEVESFEQTIGRDPAPVLQWALLLACTGVRRGEAEKLRWSDVDLEHGVLRVFASKTGAMRYVPLIGDPAGDVAPGFLAVLRAWRDRRPLDTFVLPSANGTPCFPKNSWADVAKSAGVNVGPQGLRRTFESMLAAIGFPASLAAFWLGHSIQVAESNYRAYRPGRLPGNTVDAVLGLTPFLDREARGQATLRLLPRTGTDNEAGE